MLLEVIDDKDVLLPLQSSRMLQILPILRTLLVGSPCPEHPFPVDPSSECHLSVLAGHGQARLQTLALSPRPYSRPHHSPYTIVTHSKQMVTSGRTKAARSSQPLWRGARPGPGQTIKHICATDWQPRMAQRHRLLIHTLAGKEETVTPPCGFLAFFVSGAGRGVPAILPH